MRNKTTLSLLLAGLLGASGAWAQTATDATTDTSAATGAMGASSSMSSDATGASSMTVPAGRVAPEVIGTQGMTAMQTAAMTRGTYLGTGEATTMVNGQPNANPEDPVVLKSRADRRTEREFKRADARSRREQAVMGQRGAAEPWQQPGGTPE